MALARALYRDADIYLFDDPISAVDSKVGRKIYEQVVKRLWREKKTVVLVTHQINYLFECDRVVIMEEGSIAYQDTPDALEEELRKFELSEKEKLKEDEEGEEEFFKAEDALMIKAEVKSSEPSEHHKISQSRKEEEVAITWRSYTSYIFFNKINYVLFPLTLLLFLSADTCLILYYRFLAGYDDVVGGSHDDFATDGRLFMGILGLLLFLQFIFLISKYTMLQVVALFSNEDLHEAMVHGLVRTPSSFFDVTPSGQLAGKFSNDLGLLDSTLAFTLIDVVEGPLICIIMFINIFSIDLFFLIPGLANLLFVVLFFLFCKEVIIRCKQLDLRAKSPIFSTVNEVVSALIQIRLFNRRKGLLQEFSHFVDQSYRATVNFWICSRAFAICISFVSGLVLLIGFVIGVRNIEANGDNESRNLLAGLYGASVLFMIQINEFVQFFLRQIISMEGIIVSVERAYMIKNLPPEKALRNAYDETHHISEVGDGSGEAWPKEATVRVENFSMRYRPELPLVLKGVSFHIGNGEKVGIVGRTGAGKSSIIQALFRIVEPEPGSVYELGDQDALQLGLHTLRHRLSVIPQTPFLFKGSIRTNLDPFAQHGDEKLWEVLQDAGLKAAVEKVRQSLFRCLTGLTPTHPMSLRSSQWGRSSCCAWQGHC